MLPWVAGRILPSLTSPFRRAKIIQMVKFSVAGLRGVVGEDLKIGDFVGLSQAFARFMEAKEVLLARDARTSGAKIYDAVKLGLIRLGVKVLEANMVTTPTAVFGTRAFDADAGLVITASHNPADQNGLKFLQPGRFLLPARSEEFINFVKDKGPVSGGLSGGYERVNALDRHLAVLLELFGKDSKEPRLRVGLDPVNGAAGPEARMLLEELGCEVHAVNFEPNGRFGRGSEPVSENLQGLRSLVKEKGLDVGFAFDPDGDRLAFVDERGRAPGEEYTVPLSARWALERRKGDIVVNLSTSRLIEQVAEEAGVAVHRTPVGEAHVVDRLLEIEGCCGGEGNGGFILPRVNATRDGLLAMAVLVQLKRKHGSLAEMVDALPTYHRHKEKFEMEWSERLAEMVSSFFPSARKDTRDGLWLSEEDFWLHLRPSNTEPVVRLILEADSRERADKILKRVKRVCVG